eukprot:gene15606-9528_t
MPSSKAVTVVVLLIVGCVVGAEEPEVPALHTAVGEGDTDKALQLLKDGADPTIRNEYGETALHITALKQDFTMVQALVDAGADINAVSDGTYPGHKVKAVLNTSTQYWARKTAGCGVFVYGYMRLNADMMFVNEEGENAFQIVEQAGERCAEVLGFMKATQVVRDRAGEL